MRVKEHEAASADQPKHCEVAVKANYFFDGDPGTSARRPRIILGVFLGVPVTFVKLLAVHVPFFVHR